MGRAGGGGSRGGGFSGGSRGFSSHSSSSRSGYSSHRSGGGYHGGYHGGYQSHYYHTYGGGPRFYYFGNGGDSGLKITTIVYIIIVITIISSLIGSFSGKSGVGGDITRSTVQREKLNSSSIVETDYYMDWLNWIDSESTLTSGMRYFYKKTGVQPYLFITNNIAGKTYGFSQNDMEQYGNALYDKLFDDEAHLLVVFCENDGNYNSFYIVGKEAKSVIDNEAGEILLDYIDHYYYSDYEDDEYFSLAFQKAADRIMKVTPNYSAIIAIGIIIVILVIVLYLWWKNKKKAKLDSMKAAKDILGADIHEFGDDSVEDLAKKYENGDFK